LGDWEKSVNDEMNLYYQNYLIRPWQSIDRPLVATLIETVLAEYGLAWDATGADQDVIEVERFYLETGGAFWVIELNGQLVGTGGYYPIERGHQAVEIRKMYLLAIARGKGLGRFFLGHLEAEIAAQGFKQVWVETATVLKEAVQLYERSGYQPATGVETPRCDRIYSKDLMPND
jgi:putative acetyltransferase